MKQIIAVLKKIGYNIETKEYVGTNGYTRIYIMSINGIKYTTKNADQVRARKELDRLVANFVD